MSNFEWIPLTATAGLVASYFTIRTRRFRQYIFLGLCAIGAGVGAYGFIRFAQLPLNQDVYYFRELGLSLSLVVGVTLCFAALMLERTFNNSELKKWVYPGLCWYFAVWVGLALGSGSLKPVSGTYSELKLNLWDLTFAAFIFAGFVSTALSSFNLRLFQLLLPLVFILFLLALRGNYEGLMAGWVLGGTSPRTAELWRTSSSEAFKNIFFRHLWDLFWLFGYFYINAKVHADRLKQNAFVKKLPSAGICIVVASFLYEFPELDWFRDIFPLGAELFEGVIVILDIAIIPAFLGNYWWSCWKRRFT